MNTATLPDRNIGVPGETSGADMRPKRFFRVSDVARMWGEESARARARKAGLDEAAAVAAAKPLPPRTVSRYLQQSKPGGLYDDNRVPQPEYEDEEPKPGQIPSWVPDDGETMDELEQRIRAWWHSRRGPGAGGGRPRRVRAATEACPCGCGEQVAPGTMCDRSAAERAGAGARR